MIITDKKRQEMMENPYYPKVTILEDEKEKTYRMITNMEERDAFNLLLDFISQRFKFHHQMNSYLLGVITGLGIVLLLNLFL